MNLPTHLQTLFQTLEKQGVILLNSLNSLKLYTVPYHRHTLKKEFPNYSPQENNFSSFAFVKGHQVGSFEAVENVFILTQVSMENYNDDGDDLLEWDPILWYNIKAHMSMYMLHIQTLSLCIISCNIPLLSINQYAFYFLFRKFFLPFFIIF